MHLLLIGCGKMGGALLRGWIRHASASSIVLIDPNQPNDEDLAQSGVTWHASPTFLPTGYKPSAIIFAVKPPLIERVLPIYSHYRDSVFLSVAAGKKLESLLAYVGNRPHAIVRAMPNLPSSVGEGMSVAVANQHVTETQRKLCDALLSACGQVAWVDDEELMDAVTALSGCGPAYIFALIEAMQEAGESLGLPSKLAEQLARQTVIGAGALLAKNPEQAANLRQSVASPGGSTEAALKHLLSDDGLGALMLRAMQAAAKRSKEQAE